MAPTAEAGVRAARLAAAGATADPAAMDQWLELLGGDPARVDVSGPAVPGGLAIKMFPCCYALQRPISALREQLPARVRVDDITAITVRTPESTVRPLIHHRPQTGLQGKFSLEYAIAAALLDPLPDIESFTGAAVTRPEAQRLVHLVETTLTPDGDWLMAGTVDITVQLRDGTRHSVSLHLPPGSPGRPPSPQDMQDKLTACGSDVPALLADVDWARTATILAEQLPGIT